jgi:GWxTD domain-containing protein
MDTILGALGESSVRATVIAIAVTCTLRGMRVKSPVICHRAWTGVLLVMLILPVISIWAPRISIPLLPAASNPEAQKPQDAFPGEDRSPNVKVSTAGAARPDALNPIKSPRQAGEKEQSGFRHDAYQTVVIIYLIGFLILIVRLLAGVMLSYRLARNALRDGKGFYLSRLSAPLTIGLFRPRILLPQESRQWDSGKLSAVLIHEKEHVRRRDPLVQWLGLLNRCIYWFHPLAWWLCGKLSALAEQSCDEAVIARGHDRMEYAGHLLDFARSVKQRGALVKAWGSSLHGGTLALRIRRIVTAGWSPAVSRVRVVVVTGLCAGASLVPAICDLTHAQAAPLILAGISGGAPAMTSLETRVAQYQHSRTAVEGTVSGSDASSSPARRLAPHEVEVTRYPSSQANSPNPPDKTLHDAGLDLLKKHRYNEARKMFQLLINTYPDSQYSASSYVAIADSFNEEGGEVNLLRAEDQYKNFLIFFPADPKSSDAEIKIILLNMNMRRTSVREDEYLSEYYRRWLDEDVIYLLAEHFRRWLTEEVVYIISKEEKKAFLDLKTDEEREHFIEQFWARRNPEPQARENAFKEEHYRRLAYANRRFGDGAPGWITDRGRIYIKYGPPSEIASNLSGGTFNTEYGQIKVAFPSEYWRYRHIEGVGDNITILFTDRTGTGDYRVYSPSSEQR